MLSNTLYSMPNLSFRIFTAGSMLAPIAMVNSDAAISCISCTDVPPTARAENPCLLPSSAERSGRIISLNPKDSIISLNSVKSAGVRCEPTRTLIADFGFWISVTPLSSPLKLRGDRRGLFAFRNPHSTIPMTASTAFAYPVSSPPS